MIVLQAQVKMTTIYQLKCFTVPLGFEELFVSHENETAAKRHSHFWFQNRTVLTKEGHQLPGKPIQLVGIATTHLRGGKRKQRVGADELPVVTRSTNKM